MADRVHTLAREYPCLHPRPATTRLQPVPATDACLFTEDIRPAPAPISAASTAEYRAAGVRDFGVYPIAVPLAMRRKLDADELIRQRAEEDKRVREVSGSVAYTEEDKAWHALSDRVWNALPSHLAWRRRIVDYVPLPTGPSYYREVVMNKQALSPRSIFGGDGAPNPISFIVTWCDVNNKPEMLAWAVANISMRAYFTINDMYARYAPTGDYSEAMPPYLVYLCPRRHFRAHTLPVAPTAAAGDDASASPPRHSGELSDARILDLDAYEYARRSTITDFVYAMFLQVEAMRRPRAASAAADDEPAAAAPADEAPERAESKRRKRASTADDEVAMRANARSKSEPHEWCAHNLCRQPMMFLSTAGYRSMPIPGAVDDFNAVMTSMHGPARTDTHVKSTRRRWFAQRNALLTVEKHIYPESTSCRYADHGVPMFVFHLFGAPEQPTFRGTASLDLVMRTFYFAHDLASFVGTKATEELCTAVRAFVRAHATTAVATQPAKRARAAAAAAAPARARRQTNAAKQRRANESEMTCFTRNAASRRPLSAVRRRYCFYTNKSELYALAPALVGDAPMARTAVVADYDEQSPSYMSVEYVLWCIAEGHAPSSDHCDTLFPVARDASSLPPPGASDPLQMAEWVVYTRVGERLMPLSHVRYIRRFNTTRAAYDNRAGDAHGPSVAETVYSMYAALCCVLRQERDVVATLCRAWHCHDEPTARNILAALSSGRELYHRRMEHAFLGSAYPGIGVRSAVISAIGHWDSTPGTCVPTDVLGLGFVHASHFELKELPRAATDALGDDGELRDYALAAVGMVNAGALLDLGDMPAPVRDIVLAAFEQAFDQTWEPALWFMANRTRTPLVLCTTADRGALQWADVYRRVGPFDAFSDSVIGALKRAVHDRSGELHADIRDHAAFTSDGVGTLRVMAMVLSESRTHPTLLRTVTDAIERAGASASVGVFGEHSGKWLNVRADIAEMLVSPPHELSVRVIAACCNTLRDDVPASSAAAAASMPESTSSRLVDVFKSLVMDPSRERAMSYWLGLSRALAKARDAPPPADVQARVVVARLLAESTHWRALALERSVAAARATRPAARAPARVTMLASPAPPPPAAAPPTLATAVGGPVAVAAILHPVSARP